MMLARMEITTPAGMGSFGARPDTVGTTCEELRALERGELESGLAQSLVKRVATAADWLIRVEVIGHC